jgi:membrane protein DedA with SNARE-associated domain
VHFIDDWLALIPPLSVYLIVGLVIMVESLGIPLPGEIVLVAAALLASKNHNLAWEWIAVCGTAGAIVGDSIGYLIGRRWGKSLFAWAGRKFPKHFGPKHIAKAEQTFQKNGVWAVFFGRFVAFLRILCGPLAGSLHMHYPRFLLANALGGIAWAGGTTAAVYYLGVVAETWLSRFSYVGLGVAVVAGLIIGSVVKKRMMGSHDDDEDTPATDAATSAADADTTPASDVH